MCGMYTQVCVVCVGGHVCCVYGCVYTCMCICVVSVGVHVHICTHMHMYVICALCEYVCMDVWLVCECVCMDGCVCAHTSDRCSM